jgi:hypothetical protein
MSPTSNTVLKPCRQNKPKSATASKRPAENSTSAKTTPPKSGALASKRFAIGSKASANPAASHFEPSKESSSEPESRRDTIQIDWFLRDTGELFESDEWPRSLWRKVLKRSKSLKVTPGVYITDLLQTAIGQAAQLNIEASDETKGRLLRVANVLELEPGQFAGEILRRYMQEIFQYGKLWEFEVDAVSFDSEEDRERITKASQAFDAERRECRASRRVA